MADRTSIPKSTRFEVFKRDKFKCQYCGAAAPNVLLEIDHIQPVSKGGTNEITNLVAACADCNRGKGARELSDDTVVRKQRHQLEELQERREQLEMMMEWARSARSVAVDAAEHVAEYWNQVAGPDFFVNDTGLKKLRKWLRKFSIEEITLAMNTAADAYLEQDSKGSVVQETWEHAFSKIPGICFIERLQKEDPAKHQLYMIRALARRNYGYINETAMAQLLEEACEAGITTEFLRNRVHGCRSWTQFRENIEADIRWVLQKGTDDA
ncbi:MAG: HNH endonuclease, partial [Candidatus Krumholzibacteriota bacterium]|nr:HNH endonuclease [Candidatus Krumholzibacteriota bacterium]